MGGREGGRGGTLIELAAMKFPYDCGGGGEFVMVMAITTGRVEVANYLTLFG